MNKSLHCVVLGKEVGSKEKPFKGQIWFSFNNRKLLRHSRSSPLIWFSVAQSNPTIMSQIGGSSSPCKSHNSHNKRHQNIAPVTQNAKSLNQNYCATDKLCFERVKKIWALAVGVVGLVGGIILKPASSLSPPSVPSPPMLCHWTLHILLDTLYNSNIEACTAHFSTRLHKIQLFLVQIVPQPQQHLNSILCIDFGPRAPILFASTQWASMAAHCIHHQPGMQSTASVWNISCLPIPR